MKPLMVVFLNQSHAGCSAHPSHVVCELVSSPSLPFIVGCGRPQAAVGSQSNPVSRQPLGVVQRPGRIPKPKPGGTGHWAHPH